MLIFEAGPFYCDIFNYTYLKFFNKVTSVKTISCLFANLKSYIDISLCLGNQQFHAG